MIHSTYKVQRTGDGIAVYDRETEDLIDKVTFDVNEIFGGDVTKALAKLKNADAAWEALTDAVQARLTREAYSHDTGADAVARVRSVLATITEEGLWTFRRAGNGSTGSRPTQADYDLVEAITQAASHRGQTLDPDKVTERVRQMTKEDKATYRHSPEIAAELQRIRADRRSTQVQDSESSVLSDFL